MDLDIHPEIERARTLPGAFYTSAEVHAAVRDRVFARTWQWVGHAAEVTEPGDVRPVELLPGLLDEQLLLARDGDELRCLSNVCTHRGNLVQPEACNARGLRCGYHGRRFGLDGTHAASPEFEGARDFPAPSDDLPRLPVRELAGQLFTSLAPQHDFEELVANVRTCLDRLALGELHHDAARSRDYLVEANWALYVDNYLEGFHVPYVHPSLARALDSSTYTVETQALSSLQVGRPSDDGPVFEHAPDVAAYYYWLFPGTMLNLYPWGLSVNVVEPLAVDRTRVLFRSFVARPELLDRGAGGALDEVQLEDQRVVEQVQRGVRSRLYDRGRYSPKREVAVHHFHRLLQRALA